MDRPAYCNLLLNYFILLLFVPVPLPGQENPQSNKPGDIGESAMHTPYREMVYIHTDRSFYLTGEYVKFKVYCLERSTSRPSRLSKVAYVEIYNSNQSLLLRSRIGLNGGTGTGEIYIPTSANTGNLIIRGYTRWMRNDGPGSFFHATLAVVNPFKNPGFRPDPVNSHQIPKLFVEGGMLIQNLPAKIIVLGEGNNEMVAGLSGKLVANDSILISEFNETYKGLGSFEFTPLADVEYHIEILQDTRTLHRLPLTPVNTSGISMRLIDNGPEYRVEFFCNDPSIVKSSDELRFVTVQKGTIISEESRKAVDEFISFTLSKDLFDDGVFTITAVNQAGKSLISRKGFKFSGSKNGPGIQLNKSAFETRDEVILDIPGLTRNEKNGAYDFSVSVSASTDHFRRKYVSLDHYLLLDNSLNYIHDIESYFEGSTEKVSRSINNLLIAYPNENSEVPVAGPEKATTYLQEVRAPLATGRIYNRITGEPGDGILGYLSVPGKLNRFYVSKAGSDGLIFFELTGFSGKSEIIVQCHRNDSLYMIELDDPFSDEYQDISIPELRLPQELRSWLEQQSQNMQVENSYRKYRLDSPMTTSPDPTILYNQPDHRYYLDDYTRFTVMEEVMREYVAYVYVRRNSDGFHFRVNDLEFGLVYEDNPLMLLDGVPVFDADDIMALDPLLIEKIETITRAYGLGYLDCHGIVSYTSYDGDLAGFSLPRDAFKIDYESIEIEKNHLFPDYSSSDARMIRIPDFRNSLFWLTTRDYGKDSTIDFFTSDDVNLYEIRINGISREGKSFSDETIFQVK
jgi:hypothetical protein